MNAGPDCPIYLYSSHCSDVIFFRDSPWRRCQVLSMREALASDCFAKDSMYRGTMFSTVQLVATESSVQSAGLFTRDRQGDEIDWLVRVRMDVDPAGL